MCIYIYAHAYMHTNLYFLCVRSQRVLVHIDVCILMCELAQYMQLYMCLFLYLFVCNWQQAVWSALRRSCHVASFSHSPNPHTQLTGYLVFATLKVLQFELVHVNLCVYTHAWSPDVYIDVHINTYMYICIANVHIHIYIYTHTYRSYRHTCIYITLACVQIARGRGRASIQAG